MISLFINYLLLRFHKLWIDEASVITRALISLLPWLFLLNQLCVTLLGLWNYFFPPCRCPVWARSILTNTNNTLTHLVHCLPPCLKRAQGGFVGLWKRPRKMFSDKLFTILQSLLGRVLHRTAWRITPSPCLFSSLPSPLFLHHSLTLWACPFLLRVSVPFFFLRSLFCILRHWASCPQRRAQLSGKLSLIMVAINNMS